MDEEMLHLLHGALIRLYRAQEALRGNTSPYTPPPRFRRFHLAGEIVWPYADKVGDRPDKIGAAKCSDHRGYDNWHLPSDPNSSIEAAKCLLKECRYQPRLVLRALRRIEAAIAWCQARTEGRRRAAEEILRQQAKALETLEAMAAQEALARLNR